MSPFSVSLSPSWRRWRWLALAMALSLPAQADAAPIDHPLDRALAAIGLTTATAGLAPRAYEPAPGEQRLRLARELLEDPFHIPYRLSFIKEAYLRNTDTFHGLLLTAGPLIDAPVRRGQHWNPLWEVEHFIAQHPDNPAFDQWLALYERLGQTPPRDHAANRRRLAALDQRLNHLLALFFHAVGQTWEFHRLALADAAPFLPLALETERPDRFRDHTDEERARRGKTVRSPHPDTLAALEQVDRRYLMAGALELALAVDRIVASYRDTPCEAVFSLRLDTPLGRVEAHSHGDQVYDGDGHPLLILDLRGDDRYGAGGGARCLDFPIGVLIDMEGDDIYRASGPTGGHFGGALVGYGFHYDGAGNDLYASRFASQGAGALGVGVLIDRGGDDVFIAQNLSQGAGWGGVGILASGGGNNRYISMVESQGFGACLGHGALIDQSGDDRYELHDPSGWFPSLQEPTRSLSMGQGMGQGARDDLGSGHSIGGGFGLLIDGEGDDTYLAGLFAQGVGYWGGVGALLDDHGDDTYQGYWYNQGAAAHFAVGVLIDLDGDDHYSAPRHMALGAGHDFSIGLFIDRAGDDRYEVGSLALGAGNENGWGVAIDMAGDDHYRVLNPSIHRTLGAYGTFRTGTIREDLATLGLFMDLGGADIYEGVRPFVRPLGDNTLVPQPRDHPTLGLRTERAVFLDGEYGGMEALPLGPKTPWED